MDGWSTQTDFTSAISPGIPQAAMDPDGNATVVWEFPGTFSVYAARRTEAGVWSTYQLPGARNFNPHVAFDSVGNARVVWRHTRLAAGQDIQSTDWLATPAAPTISAVIPGDRVLAVDFVAPQSEPGFINTNYEYSLDDGTTWTVRSPPSIASPLILTGLTNGITYVVRLRGINLAGAGGASAPAIGTPALVPLPPRNLTVTSIVGNTITVRWTPPTIGLLPTGYVLEGGLTIGSVLASLPTGSTAPTFTFTAPTGVFYIRLHSIIGSIRSGPSNEILIFVNTASPPSAPTGLLGLAAHTNLILSWQNTWSGGGAPSGVILDVSGNITTSIPLPLVESFSFSGVPDGDYTFAMRAFNALGTSGPSNSVKLTFPGTCLAPDTPSNFAATKSGNTIFTSWGLPPSGAAPTGYTVIVTGTFSGSFPTSGLSLSGTAGPGSYTVSVVATNPCGVSTPTPRYTITIP